MSSDRWSSIDMCFNKCKVRVQLARERQTTSRMTDGQERNPDSVGLRQHLGREGTRHLERRMARSGTQIQQSA